MRRSPTLLFVMRLALQLGRADFRELAHELTLEDLAMWEAYWSIEPFGDDWRRTSRQTIVLGNVFGAKMKAEMEEQLMPGYNPFHKTQTAAEMTAELKKITNGHK